jgi:DNA-binding transcriptional regulator LsrR (DeoR family)
LIAGYRMGSTMKALAAEFGIDRRTVSTYLRRAEIAVRRGGLDQKQAIEAARLYEAGWSSGRLAERFKVSADNVLKVLRQAELAIRTRRGGPAPNGADV